MRNLNVRQVKLFCRYILGIAIISCIAGNSSAQICQESLGDPIVNITFGSGQNPGAPLPAATTNYSYVATDCPKDGNYTVRNKTENCFDNLWYPVTDHTGDANGYFMLVNASYDPGQFYLDTVRGLCGGTTYEFAAWLINVSKPVLCWGATQIILPDITFRIERTDGTLLGTYNTGNISSADPPQWEQYGFFFTTPASVNEVVIRMVNNAPGGCGNDVGLDDITFRACGPQVTASISGINSNTDTACGGTGKDYTFTAQSSGGYNNPVYQWQKKFNDDAWINIPGEIAMTYDVNFPANATAGEYLYRLLAAESGNINSTNCRVASSPLKIVVIPEPDIAASGNGPVCEGSTIQLSASGNNIKWSGPNGFSVTGNNVTIPNAQQVNAGDYFATSQQGSCGWTDIVNIGINPKPFAGITPDSVSLCEGDSIMLEAAGANTYAWQPANGLKSSNQQVVTASPSSSTTYLVIGSNVAGCIDTATAHVRINKRPKANAGYDLATVKGTNVQLNGAASGDSISYYWTPKYMLSNDKILNPVTSSLVDTVYILHVVSDAGCGYSTDSMKITIYKEIVIPNAFSPNGDNVNDRWNIAGINSYPRSEVVLFDRYGKEIFRKYAYQPWDGTRGGQPVPVGVYYYVIDLRNGSAKMTGSLYLAR